MTGRFRVIAIISAYNEGDIISPVIEHLVENRVDVYLLDNHSTDDTVERARPWLRRGLLKIETFPAEAGGEDDRFHWSAILRRKEQLVSELRADWFIHHDADEFRESPWPNVSLRDAIRWVDALDYNCIDFRVLTFRPVDDGFRSGLDPRAYFTYFEKGADFDKVQLKCWKAHVGPVSLVEGGHEARFANRRVFPIPFLLRHYPIRGQEHGRRKVFSERKSRFRDEERRKGWHVQYDTIRDESHRFVAEAESLSVYDANRIRLELMLESAAGSRAECAALEESLRRTAAERERLAAELEGLHGERDSLAAELRRTVAERNELEKERALRDRDVAERDRALAEVSRKLAGFEHDLVEQERTLGEISKERALLQKDLAERDLALAHASEKLTTLEHDLSERERVLRDVAEERALLHRDLAERDQASLHASEKLAAREHQVSEQEQSLHSLSGELGAARAATNDLDQQLSERTWRLEQLSRALATTRASIWWKAGAPFRRAGAALRRRSRMRPRRDPGPAALSHGDFIDFVYHGILGREADERGRAHHFDLLWAGRSRDELIRAFVESREFHFRLTQMLRGRDPSSASEEDFVAYAFRILLLREPGAEELADNAARLRSGFSRTELLVELIHSPDFASRHLGRSKGRPSLERIVAFDAEMALMMGRARQDDEPLIQQALSGPARTDSGASIHWLNDTADEDPRGRRFLATSELSGKTGLDVPPDWLASKNGDATTVVRVSDPFAARRAVLECLSITSWTPALCEYLHPTLKRLTDRCRTRVAVDRALTFGKTPARPNVSVVIPLYRRLDFMEHQISQFADDHDFASAELIYVLDSPEQAAELEKKAHQLFQLYGVPLRLVVLQENVGYSGANNAGVRSANGRHLLLLNSDIIPIRAGWLRTMTEFYDSRQTIGALGAKLLYDDGSLQHAGVYFTRDHDSSRLWHNMHYFKGFPRHYAPADVVRRVPAVTGACLMISRELYDAVGGLSEQYVQGAFEDSDLCLSCAREGRQNWYLPTVEMHHLEGRSFQTIDAPWLSNAYFYNCWLQTKLWDGDIASIMGSTSDDRGGASL